VIAYLAFHRKFAILLFYVMHLIMKGLVELIGENYLQHSVRELVFAQEHELVTSS
jgi:hypothetical protein